VWAAQWGGGSLKMELTVMPKSGFIYVLRNDLMPGLVKIGQTTRSAEHCASEISGGTGVPDEFVVAFQIEVTDCELVEQLVHEKLSAFRVNEKREFFKLSVEDAIEAVQEVAKKCQLASDDEAVVGETLPDGLTKLMRACLKNDVGLVTSLLARGADPNTATEDGVTALMMAAARGYGKIADLLLERGAHLDARAHDGTTAHSLAKERGHITTCNVLNFYKRGAHVFGTGHSSLTNACARRDYESVVALLEGGSDPNEPSDAGDLPLDIAAISGSTRLIEVLLKFGARSGRAASLAEANGHFVSSVLIEKYASLSGEESKD